MGEAQSIQQKHSQKSKSQSYSSFLQHIQKVSQMHTQEWGNFDLYQQKEKPYDYYMRFVQNQIDEAYIKRKQTFYQSLKQPKNKNIVPVAFTEVSKNKGICNTVFQIAVYCQYFNFTLQNAIKLKIRQKQQFTLSDVLYVIKCLVQIGKFCEQQRKECSYMGIFITKNIFITPEGHLRIYPFSQNLCQMFSNHNDQQQSSAFYKFILKQQKIEKKKTQPAKEQLSIRNSNSSHQNNSSRQIKKGIRIMNHKQQFFMSQPQNQHSQMQIKRKMSNQQSLSFNSHFSSIKRQDIKDFFDFGLVLLQILLLNEKEYYQLFCPEKNKIYLEQTDKAEFYKRYNMDKIRFSIQKQLAYRKVPKKIISLISQMILEPQSMNYQIIQKTLNQVQQSGINSSFCLRFDQQNQQNLLQISKISSNLNEKLEKESEKSFKIIEQPQSIYLEEIQDLKNFNKTMKSNFNIRNNSSSSFFKNEKKEEGNSKLKKSLMLSNGVSKQSLLSNMKIDKFLIPRKIRSISTQVSKNCSEKQL